jgi:hypothetical protein
VSVYQLTLEKLTRLWQTWIPHRHILVGDNGYDLVYPAQPSKDSRGSRSPPTGCINLLPHIHGYGSDLPSHQAK